MNISPTDRYTSADLLRLKLLTDINGGGVWGQPAESVASCLLDRGWTHDEPSRKGLNPSVVLAAIDQMLAPYSLHPGTELSSLKVKIRRLRKVIVQYCDGEDNGIPVHICPVASGSACECECHE